MYWSLQSYKLDFNIVVLNLMSLLALYVSLDSSFISTKFFVLGFDGWFDVYEKKHNNEISKNNESINLLFLDIPLLY